MSAGAVVVAVMGAKGAPGATASVLALACGWPRPVLVVDADPAGGDVAAGWLGGRVGLDRGLLSFAAATRHAEAATAADLAPHVVTVPDAPGVMVLPGLAHAGQAGGLDDRLWARLLIAASSPWPAADPEEAGGGAGPVRVDVLADCGRISAGTPWSLLAVAAVVLLATRPTLRGVHHARYALSVVQAAAGDVGRMGLLVCGPGVYEPAEIERAVGLPVRVVLPADGPSADALADGATGGNGSRGAHVGRGWSRTLLARAARRAAQQLASAAALAASGQGQLAAPADEGLTAGWTASQQPLAGVPSTAENGRR
jgi:hypothetical protein